MLRRCMRGPIYLGVQLCLPSFSSEQTKKNRPPSQMHKPRARMSCGMDVYACVHLPCSVGVPFTTSSLSPVFGL